MVSSRELKRSLAKENAAVLFYQVIEKGKKRMLKPLKFETQISLALVRAILDDTVIPTFYDTLSRNLRERGIEPGTTVQLRVKFTPGHALIDPQLTGTRVLCEVKVTQ